MKISLTPFSIDYFPEYATSLWNACDPASSRGWWPSTAKKAVRGHFFWLKLIRK